MVGLTISHYKIIEKLGEGGMGVVYKAHDTKLDRCVAIKFLSASHAVTEHDKTRFIHEACAASALEHSNICAIYEIDETSDGQFFLVMPAYEGIPLNKKIEEKPLAIDEAITIAIQIADGLQAAHEKGIVHRDIKSSNIFITQKGQVKIMDFGLARSPGMTQVTKTGTTVGTVPYMSPEQARGEKLDHRTDIWSLGVIVYEMITGRMPFQSDYSEAIVYSILNEEPEPLSSLRSNIPMELERVVKKSLNKDKSSRYQNAEDIVVDLRQLHKTKDRTISSLRQHKHVTMPIRKTSAYYWIGVVLMIFIVVLFFLIKPDLFDTAAVSEPKPIAVIPFVNQTGDPSYDYLSDAIPNLLITSLEQSKYLRVLTWERMNDVLNQMGKAGVHLIDRDLGFELCRYEGIDAIVLGSFIKAGDVFATDVKLLDVDTKELLISASARGNGVQSILNNQIDELSKEIARGVGLSQKTTVDLTQKIASVTTNSMEAYNAYLRGREQYEKGYWLVALPSLEQAVKLDTAFAMAYLYLGRAYATRANTRAAHENYEKAMTHAARASEKERLYIEATYASLIERNPDKRFEILKIMEERYPKEKQVYADLGLYYVGQGMHKEAFVAYNKALMLDPNYGIVLDRMAEAYAELENYITAIEYLERYAAANPGEPIPLVSMGDMYFYMGDMESALAMYHKALEIQPENFSSFKISFIYGLLEDYDAAAQWIDNFLSHSPATVVMGGARAFKSIYYRMRGERHRAALLVDEAQRMWESMDNLYFSGLMDWSKAWFLLSDGRLDPGLEVMERSYNQLIDINPSAKAYYTAELELYRGMAAVRKGEMQTARRHLAVMESQLSQISRIYEKQVRYEYTLFHGSVLLAEGQPDSAISVMHQAVAARPFNLGAGVLGVYSIISFYPPFRDVVARAYLQKDQIHDAISEYEHLTTFNPGKEDRRFISPEYHYELAKLYEQTGQRERAIDKYEYFLRLWKNADPDIPELIDAKMRLAKLKVVNSIL
jgi:serine/threonine protein kinase/tetratricopeptide (TPR) repeat protein